MKREQVFVRAQTPSGLWCVADVMDLDEESFRAFILGILFRAELVCGLVDEACPGETIILRTRVEPPDGTDRE